MTNKEEFKMPRKFTFDEFYEMLKEYVNDPKARAALAAYDAEVVAGTAFDADRGNDLTKSAGAAVREYYSVGEKMMERRGWPTYSEIYTRFYRHDYDKYRSIKEAKSALADITRNIIRKEPDPKPYYVFQNQTWDIDDRTSIIELLKLWSERSPNVNMPYALTGDE